MSTEHPLIQHIRRYVMISDEELHTILSAIQLIPTIKKKEIWLQEGQLCNHVGFVISGCMRSYSVDDQGIEHILQFAPQGWWITDMYSFLHEQPSLLRIDALIDSELILLTRKTQLALFDQIPAFERYFRIITEYALCATRQRVIDHMHYTAKERYIQFCNNYPGIMHSIPQKYIASYLGVTPEFLSKLRSQLGS